MSSGEQKFYEKNKFLTRITKKLCDNERITVLFSVELF